MQPWIVVPDKPVFAATTVLPPAATEGLSATWTVLGGTPVTILPHDFHTWSTLRERGLLAPSPLCRYRWPGMKTPRPHQRETVEFYLRHRRAFDLSGMRCGKTLSALWGMDYLMSVGAVKRALIVAPVSIMDIVWERELFQSFGHLDFKVLSGSRAKKQKDAAAAQVSVVNPESLHLLLDVRPEWDLVVVDEFTKFKNARSKLRYPALKAIARHKRLWMLGALPAPQRSTDAYGPLRLVNPEYIAFTKFRLLTMERDFGHIHKWKERPDADVTIAKWMQPAIRHRREDCIDIPDYAIEEFKVGLSTAQKKIIKDLLDKAAFELDGETINAANASAVLGKILQVMAGGVYTTEAGETGDTKVSRTVDAAPFYEAVELIAENTEGPVLMFTSYVNTAEYTAAHLTKAGFKVGVITGNTPKNERTVLFDRVQAKDLDVLVAVPGTMSHGLNLTASSTVVWLTPPFEYEVYDQANHRVLGSDQKRKVLILHLIQNRVALERFRALESKESLQSSVLKLIEGRSNVELRDTGTGIPQA